MIYDIVSIQSLSLEEITMVTPISDYTEQLHQEIEQTPEEFHPLLFRIVHSFREGVMLPTAEESFSEGWQDVKNGNAHSVDTLWDGWTLNQYGSQIQ